MNTAHQFLWMLSERASVHASSWRCITVRFAKFGTGWVYAGIYILRQERKITIALRKISFLRCTTKGTSSKTLCSLPIVQPMLVSYQIVILRERVQTAVIQLLAVFSAIIADIGLPRYLREGRPV